MPPPTRWDDRIAGFGKNPTVSNRLSMQFRQYSGGVMTPPYMGAYDALVRCNNKTARYPGKGIAQNFCL